MSKADLRVDWASHESAKYAVEHWHYTKSLPFGKMVKVGAWENNQFIGVVIFSFGANKNIGKPYGLIQIECCELVRIALNNHITPVSKIMARAIKMLKKQSSGVRLIISYADTNQGHIGSIYQATNWIYVGETKPTKEYFLNGRFVHGTLAKEYGSVKGLKSRPSSIKHKYIMPLNDEMRTKIAPLAKPYPKRPKQATDSDQESSGSATLTRTLQID